MHHSSTAQETNNSEKNVNWMDCVVLKHFLKQVNTRKKHEWKLNRNQMSEIVYQSDEFQKSWRRDKKIIHN